MFDRVRHQPQREGTSASTRRTEAAAAPGWLRRPVFARHADRDVGAHLHRELSGLGAVIHGVRLADTELSVDHLVVAPSGIWLIETAHLAGRVSHRTVGTRDQPASQMLLDGVDSTPLVNSLGVLTAAREVVTAMQFGVDVQTATCLVDATWPASARPFEVNGHWITWPRALTDKIQSFGLLPIRTAHDIADAIIDHQRGAAMATLWTASPALAS